MGSTGSKAECPDALRVFYAAYPETAYRAARDHQRDSIDLCSYCYQPFPCSTRLWALEYLGD